MSIADDWFFVGIYYTTFEKKKTNDEVRSQPGMQLKTLPMDPKKRKESTFFYTK